LALDTFELADGLVGSICYLLLNLGVHRMPDEEEKRARESENDQQGGDEELRS